MKRSPRNNEEINHLLQPVFAYFKILRDINGDYNTGAYDKDLYVQLMKHKDAAQINLPKLQEMIDYDGVYELINN